MALCKWRGAAVATYEPFGAPICRSLFCLMIALAVLVSAFNFGTAWGQERHPIAKEYLGDRPSEDALKGIEQQEQERASQNAERAAREAEVRRMLREIRERLFDIEMFFAQRKDGVRSIDCEAASRQAADFQARIEDAEGLRAQVVRACSSAAAKGTQSQAVCSDQTTVLQVEISKLKEQRASLLSECPKR